MPDYHLAARRAAIKFGVDPNIFLRMIGQESGFQPHVKSPAGARGIAQFMPATARAYGVNLNDNRVTDDLEGAAKYLRANLDRTGGSYTRALSIYNSGSPTGYQHIAETKNYVRSILGGRTPTSPSSGGSQGGSDGSGLAGRLSGSVTPGQVTGGGFDPGTPDVSSLADLLGSSRPQPVAPQLPAAPFSPSKYLHLGQSPVVAQSQPEASGGGIDSLLSAMQSSGQEIPQTSVSAAQTSVSGSAPTAHASSAGGGSRGGVAHFDGKPVASWIKPLLQYARERGWKGTVTSGVRTDAEQKAIYDRGTRPAAVPKAYGGAGSNHERTGFLQGAVDVSDAATLDRILRAKHSRLKFAGAKDPVHFSVPRNGSY